MGSFRKQARLGLIWTFIEMFGGQVINFFVNIILARKLFPEDYGILGMILVFVTISNTLMDSGLSSSILRTKDVKDNEYATLFTSNIFFSIVFYIILYCISPLISKFYGKEILTDILRLYGLNLIIQAFVQVQSIYLIKKLDFKKQTFMKLPSILVSSLIGIYMAYSGYGVWSLIWMYLIQNFLWALFHWFFGAWNPYVSFDYAIFKKHFKYGYKMTLLELMNNMSTNIYQIVIGRLYNPVLVGFYTQSLTLRQMPISNLYVAFMKVFFPIFVEIKDDRKLFVKYYIQNQNYLIMILTPIFSFMIFFSNEIMIFFYSDKWANAGFFLTFLAMGGILTVISTFNLNMLKILEDSGIVLKLEIVNKTQNLLMIAAVIVFFNKIEYLMMTIPISLLLGLVMINYLVINSLNITSISVLKNIIKNSVLGFLPTLIVYLIFKYLVSVPDNSIQLFTTFFAMIIIYLILLILFNKNSLKLLFYALKR